MSRPIDSELLADNNGRESAGPVDFTFLETQTFGDKALERELLELFVAQARRVLSTLSDLPFPAQSDAAHLLKGSARGIGAWDAARAAAAYEAAPATGRADANAAIAAAFETATTAIEIHLR